LPIAKGGTGKQGFTNSGTLYYDADSGTIDSQGASTLPVSSGGTGTDEFSPNTIVVCGGSNNGPLASLGSGISGKYLRSNGPDFLPSFEDAPPANLATATGVLPTGKGGTGLTELTPRALLVGGQYPYSNVTQISVGSAGQLLAGGTSFGYPTWISEGTTGQVLVSNGTSSPTWQTPSSGVSDVDELSFDTTPTSSDALTEGQLRWDSTWRTLDVALAGGLVSQYGEQTIIRGRIGGGTVNIGDPIYQYGQASDYFFIAKASSDSQGFNAIHSGIGINVGASGSSFTYTYAVMRGVARDVPTPSGGGSGSPIYLTSAGALTVTAPAFPARRIRVGFIIKTSTNTSTNDGTILVDPHYYDAVSARSGGIISQFYSPVATVNADDTLLNSYTVSPSTFTADGDTIDAEYMLTRASTNAAQTHNVLFNGSSVFGGAITISANTSTSAKIFVKLIRRSSSAIAASFEFQYAHADGSASQVRHGASTISYNTGASADLVLRGTSVAGAPLFAQYGEISFNPSSIFVI
jgi:hypothetical protein